MPIYNYKCSKCGVEVEQLREMDQQLDILSCEACKKGKLEFQFSSQIAVIMADTLPEAVQWWKPNPKAPNGCEVFPHKNKFVSGGIGDGRARK